MFNYQLKLEVCDYLIAADTAHVKGFNLAYVPTGCNPFDGKRVALFGEGESALHPETGSVPIELQPPRFRCIDVNESTIWVLN